MKKWISLLVFAISGCQSLIANNMLDTAPKNEFQVMYPEWGNVEEPADKDTVTRTYYVQGPNGEKRSDAIDNLTHFLSQMGIAHEVVPGSYLMIKIKQKVQFDTGSSYVSAHSRQWLSQIGAFLAGNSTVDIVIDGHTDSTGTKTVNDQLSEKRALQVKEQLLVQQVSPDAVYTRGYGEYMPACSNNSLTGKACNRRVELTLILASN